MTTDEFRAAALGLPEAEESAHMNHPDFRVRGKVFATLGPDGADWGVVKLTPEQQRQFMRDDPEVFTPVKGGWGRRGYTQVNLGAASLQLVLPALEAAWRNVVPKRLAQQYDLDE